MHPTAYLLRVWYILNVGRLRYRSTWTTRTREEKKPVGRRRVHAW